jgi:hypothetical protein
MSAFRGILKPFGRFYRVMLNGITTMEQANAALPRFIAEFNQRFHREPACKDTTAFVS